MNIEFFFLYFKLQISNNRLGSDFRIKIDLKKEKKTCMHPVGTHFHTDTRARAHTIQNTDKNIILYYGYYTQ